MCRLQSDCVVFGIGNSLDLFGRKHHCAELVHIQLRALPAQQLIVNGHTVATGKSLLSCAELVPTLPNTSIVSCHPSCPLWPLPPIYSSVDMQGDIIHSLNEHAIYGTHTHTYKCCAVLSFNKAPANSL